MFERKMERGDGNGYLQTILERTERHEIMQLGNGGGVAYK